MSLLRRWAGRAATRINSKKFKRPANGSSQDREDDDDGLRHGTEGHVFQVNDPPEQLDDQADDYQHGAEGHVFQVNDPPEQLDDQADGAP